VIPQSFLQELLNRVDIVDVVGAHVKLKRSGVNFSGLCPFHTEKTPSFTVSTTKQFYHCFGCQAHGNALGFLMEHSGLTFPEAVRELASSIGLTVPDDGARRTVDSPTELAPTLKIEEALERARDYYKRALKASQRGIQYLKDRGVTGEIAARFGLGYAPDGWQNLEAAFADYRDLTLVAAGLVIGREEGSGPAKLYDRFRDRIMFPIRNARGKVVGFGGRVLDAVDGQPKYINSPETPVFQKGSELYGLFEARAAIREAGYAIVVEGYMDVVALAQLGVANAVATLGTACTPAHVRHLLRQTSRVVFSFDGDDAGRRAAWRALEASLPHAEDNKSFAFLFLPAEHDPDSFIRANGADLFRAAVHDAVPLSQFLIRELSRHNDLGTAEGRAKTLYDAKPLLGAMPTGSLRRQIVRELGRLTKTPDSELAALLGPVPGPAIRRAPARVERKAPDSVAHQAMRLVLADPSLAQSLAPESRALLGANLGADAGAMDALLNACDAAGPDATTGMVSDRLLEGTHRDRFDQLMQQVMQEPDMERGAALAELQGTIDKLGYRKIGEEINRLAESQSDDPKSRERMRELLRAQQRLRTGS